MSARRAVGEVARREIVERSRSRVLRVTLALLLIVSAGGAVAAARLSDRTPTDHTGVVGARSVALEPAIRVQAQAAGRHVRMHQFATRSAAAKAVKDGSVAVALLDGNRIMVKTSRTGAPVRVVRDAVAAQGVLARLQASGLTRAEALSALTPATLPFDVLQPNARDNKNNQSLVFFSVLALYSLLLFFGQAVAQGVTEEKSSRVVELLLTTVSPRRLLAGKVLGIGVVGLCLVVIPAAAALAAGNLAGGAGLPSAAPKTMALMVLWFVLGYFFYSVVFAAVGALVSRQEDLGIAVVPIIIVLAGGFMLTAVVANTNPDGTLAQIAAFVPPFSPMVVPARMVLGNMGPVAFAAAVGLDLLATAGLILLAARIYERAILRIGAPVKLQRLFAAGTRPARPSPADADGLEPTPTTDAEKGAFGTERPRLSSGADLALRMAAVVLLLAGAAIGFGKPVSIALVAAGLVLLILEQTLKHLPRKPAH
jgi:ABC-2 type transport system permease protein